MSGQKTSRRVGFGKGISPRPKSMVTTAPAPQPDLSPPNEALLQRKYRKLIRQHLGKLLDKLFADFTGLHFHISWAPAPPHEWETRTLPTACSVCCRLSGSPLLPDCGTCAKKQLARALSRDGDGHCFTCRLGVRNYWFPLRIRSETLGLAYLQALDHATASPPERRRSAHVVRHRLPQTDARVMDQSEFARAGRLLRLIVHDVQTASLMDLQKADLTSAGHAVLTLERNRCGSTRRSNGTCL